jgi:serine protease AprX
VVAAGNLGTEVHAVDFAPANDPLVVTVGALDGAARAAFSSSGATQDGLRKPDLLAPGVGVVSLLASPTATLALGHPAAVTEDGAFRMSGTSVAAPAVSGAVALVLQAHPGWSPDQVKAALVASGQAIPGEAAPALDAPAAVAVVSPVGSNPGLTGPPPTRPMPGLGADDPTAVAVAQRLGIPLTDATWTSATWTSATWTSAIWTSAMWLSTVGMSP